MMRRFLLLKKQLNKNDQKINENDVSNDLSEFGVDSNAPDLFNNDNETSNSEDDYHPKMKMKRMI